MNARPSLVDRLREKKFAAHIKQTPTARLADAMLAAAKSVRAWHEDPVPTYARPGDNAGQPIDFDAQGWQVIPGPKGPVLQTPGFQSFAAITVKAWVLSPPNRFAGEPCSPLQMTICSNELLAWMASFEAWLQPKFPGPEVWKSAVKRNAYSETYLRVKFTDTVRFFNADGTLIPDLQMARGQTVYLMCSLSLYQVSGLRGVSIRALGVQADSEPKPPA